MAAQSCVTEAAAPTIRLSHPWVVLLTLLAISIFNFADRYLLTGLVGPIKQEFALGDGTIGLLMGPAFVVLYLAAGVPIARLADRTSRVKIIAAGCLLWSLATAATSLATGPVTLALARVGVGIGEAAFAAPAYSLLTDYFRPERRAFAFAVLGLATYIGQIVGQGGGPALAEALGSWRAAFVTMGIPGIVLAIAALMLIREPHRGTGPVRAAVPFGQLVRLLLGTRSYVLMALAFGLGVMSGVAFGYWGPELFTRLHALDPVEVKGAFAVYFGGAGMIGMLMFGALADRMARRGPAWPLLLAGGALAAATAAVLAAIWAPDFGTAKLLAIPSGLLGGGWSVGFMAVLQPMMPTRFRASATALFMAFTTLLGFLVGPWLAGALSEALGDDASGLRLALSLVVPAGFAAALIALMAARTLAQDIERLRHADEGQ